MRIARELDGAAERATEHATPAALGCVARVGPSRTARPDQPRSFNRAHEQQRTSDAPAPVLLLGAGAARAAQVQGSTEMTATHAAMLNEHRQGRHTQAFNGVYRAMIQHSAARGVDPSSELDVERVFAAVTLLADRRDHELTPFIARWHPAVDAACPGGSVAG